MSKSTFPELRKLTKVLQYYKECLFRKNCCLSRRNGRLCGILTCPAPITLSPTPLSSCNPQPCSSWRGQSEYQAPQKVLSPEHSLYLSCLSCSFPEENSGWVFFCFLFLSFCPDSSLICRKAPSSEPVSKTTSILCFTPQQ